MFILLRIFYKLENKLLKEIVHPIMKTLSSFTHPHVGPNLCEFLSSAELKKVGNQTFAGSQHFAELLNGLLKYLFSKYYRKNII